jgi:hypothetical protein
LTKVKGNSSFWETKNFSSGGLSQDSPGTLPIKASTGEVFSFLFSSFTGDFH